jgi:uncharacterized Tic20 family protein
MIFSSASLLASSARPLTDAASIRLGSLSHLGGILLLPPALVIWRFARGRARFAENEAKEALNWQITLGLAWLLLVLVTGTIRLVLYFTPLAALGAALDAVAPWLLYALNVVLSVIAFRASRAGDGYRYPVALRFVK